MKAIKILIPILCIALLFAGCGGFHLASSIDDLISPVAPAGADASVQSAMDAYCKGGYSVKIPAAGKYTTSYTLTMTVKRRLWLFMSPMTLLARLIWPCWSKAGRIGR